VRGEGQFSRIQEWIAQRGLLGFVGWGQGGRQEWEVQNLEAASWGREVWLAQVVRVQVSVVEERKRLVSFFPSLSRGDVAVVGHTGLAKEAFLGGVSRFLTGRISAFVLLAERSFAGRFHIAVVDETFPRHVFLLFSTFLFQINQTGDSRMLTDGA